MCKQDHSFDLLYEFIGVYETYNEFMEAHSIDLLNEFIGEYETYNEFIEAHSQDRKIQLLCLNSEL